MEDSKVLDGNQVVEKWFQIQPLLFRIAGCPIFQAKNSKFVFALAFIFLHEFFRCTCVYVYENEEHVTCIGRHQIGLPHNKRLMYSSVHEEW